MDEANKINELLNLDKAIPVIRHGEEVSYTNEKVIDLISELKAKGMKILFHTFYIPFMLYSFLSHSRK